MATAPTALNGHQADTTLRSGDQARPFVSAKLVGLTIATFVPALFWTVTVWAISHACDIEVAANTLLTIGVTIMLFLSFVCSALLGTD